MKKTGPRVLVGLSRPADLSVHGRDGQRRGARAYPRERRNHARVTSKAPRRSLSSDEKKQPQGYSVDLCREIANGIRAQLALPKLETRWVALTLQNRLEAVRSGRVDIDCSTTTWTLTRQREVDFSLITFIDGATVLARGNSDLFRLADFGGKRIAVIRSTTTFDVLSRELKSRSVAAEIVPVADRAEGLQLLRTGAVDGFASDRIVLIGLVLRDPGQRQVQAARRRFLDGAVRARASARRPRLPARGEQRRRTAVPHRRHHGHIRALARTAGQAERPAVRDVLAAVRRRIAFPCPPSWRHSPVVIRLTALLAAAVLSILPAKAQTIRIPDFRESTAVTSGSAAGACDECGVVRSIREIYRRGATVNRSRAGADWGPADTRVVGAVVVLPFGPGSNSKTGFVGGVGTPEVNERLGEVSYEIIVRMDDQTLRTVERRDGAQFAVGDRVRVSEGRVELLR